tara:strand:+ start:807 stop:1439 length:633 start_codon:yes stop_codon:yes gene_type:complete
MEKIVIIGGGGHAKVVISLLQKVDNFEIIGFVDINEKKDILGIPYLGDDKILPDLYNKGINNAVLAIGQIKSSSKRKNIYNELNKLGFNFPSIISPNSIINKDVIIGAGSVIMDGVIIESGSVIGLNCIINTSSSINHDCSIKDFCHIAPGVTISGNVNIGFDVFIGTGSNIINNIDIADNVLISAGSCVLKSIKNKGTYMGYPLRMVKK